jgi:hypothetical protein
MSIGFLGPYPDEQAAAAMLILVLVLAMLIVANHQVLAGLGPSRDYVHHVLMNWRYCLR